jgi:hypothetical protein
MRREGKKGTSAAAAAAAAAAAEKSDTEEYGEESNCDRSFHPSWL